MEDKWMRVLFLCNCLNLIMISDENITPLKPVAVSFGGQGKLGFLLLFALSHLNKNTWIVHLLQLTRECVVILQWLCRLMSRF